MQKPEIILNNLVKQSNKENYKYNRLYRYLYNPEFYYRAYGRIYSKEGNMTPGTDGKTIDGFSHKDIEKTINALKNLSYQPNPAKRVYIPKKNGKKRPLGIPSFMDKIIQEIIREILEAIYEGNFSDKSHGFRPNRSCHTALIDIKTTCTGTKWWIEGDIEGFFDNINHHTLITILRNKIEDEKFLNLIWKFLRAGYLEDWKFNTTYSGTPQGGIISPILANIYLDQLDKYVEEYAKIFNKGKERRTNKEYKKHEGYIYKLKKRLEPKWETLDQDKKDGYLKNIKERQAILRTLPRRDPYDPGFKRLKYVRYADDFIIALIGSKEEAEKVKADIKSFLQDKLSLKLSDEKTKITIATNKARFLGYDLYVARSDDYKKTKSGSKARTITGHIMLSMPYDCMRDFVFENRYAKEISNKGSKNTWKRTMLRNIDDLEILSIYNAEIRGFYQYYKYAYDVSRLGNIYNLAYFSFVKTLANKYKTSCYKILSDNVKGKSFKQDNKLGVYYTKKDKICFREFVPNSFKTCKDKVGNENVDNKSQVIQYMNSRTGLEARLKAGKCEYCGTQTSALEVHHVRKLKNLKGKKRWEILMISRKRKTMVLCKKCHDDLHAGRLD